MPAATSVLIFTATPSAPGWWSFPTAITTWRLRNVRFTPESRHSEGYRKGSAYDPKRTFVGLQGLICFTCSKGTPPSVTPISSHWRAGAIRTWAVFSPCDPQTAARAYCICLATGQRLYSHCLSMPVSTYGQHLQGQPEFSARSRPILRKFCIPCHLNHRQDVPERPGLAAAGASLGASLYGASHLGQMIFFCLRS